MSQPSPRLDALPAEQMARLMIHGMEAGYTLQDERFQRLVTAAMLLKTRANGALDQAGTLFEREAYGQAVEALTDVIKEALALRPEFEASIGAELVTFYGMRGLQRTRLNLWKDARKDVEQALSYPATYYKNPDAKLQLQELQSNIQKVDGGCFIATAAYGSPLAPEIIVLQRFRDTRMRPYRIGRWMISVYERYSPALADTMAPHPTVRLWVRRLLLTPAVFAVRRWFS